MADRRKPGTHRRFHVCAALLVLAGMSFAAGWAIFLPMFLSPDEDSHYDYALTLYTAGRPMRPAENVVGRDTHPDVEYLMSATHAREQRLDASVGADAGYGTAPYYRKLDAAAPKFTRNAYRNGRIDPVPYISRLYPVGYYALVALAIGLGNVLTHGSVVNMFFFARYLSVALLSSTLWFSWLAMLEIGLGAPRALLILAGIALFPMNAAMAGYVQPDNLAAALIAPLMYCALRLRSNPTSAWLTLISGILFGALIATKRHYFVATFVPVAMLLLVRLPFRTQPGLAFRTLAFIIMPSLAAFGVSEAMLVPASGGGGVCHFPDSYGLATQRGFPATARYLLTGFLTAFSGTFYNLTDFKSFWLNYTAYRTTPLVLGNRGITSGLESTLPFLSGTLALSFALRIAQVRKKLLQIGRGRSFRTMAKIMTSNVLVNGYLCFFIILFSFKTYSGGSIPIQGRYWFPYLPGIWICAFTIAPRLLQRRLSRRVGNTLLLSLVIFSLVASVSTFPSIHERFYEPLRSIPAKEEVLAEIAVRSNGAVSLLQGIAIDLRRASGVEQVVVRLDGLTSLAVRRVDRPDVVCDMEKTLLHTGFEADLYTSGLRRGTHRVAVFVRTPWSTPLIDSGVHAIIEVR